MAESRIGRAFSQSMATVVRFLTIGVGLAGSACVIYKGTDMLCNSFHINMKDMGSFMSDVVVPILGGVFGSHFEN